jgi:hypothetical protein
MLILTEYKHYCWLWLGEVSIKLPLLPHVTLPHLPCALHNSFSCRLAQSARKNAIVSYTYGAFGRTKLIL